MAEVKKSIKLQKLSDKTLKEFAAEVGSAEGKPESGSVNALTASMAANLSLLAATTAPEGSVPEETIKELTELQQYLMKQVDEYPRSRTPLRKRVEEEKSVEEIESAARLACGIPNEIVYLLCRNLEMLDAIADACTDEMVPNVLAAVKLSLGVIDALRAEIKYLSNFMMEFTFRYTVNREAELNVQQRQELVENLVAKLQKRLEKE